MYYIFNRLFKFDSVNTYLKTKSLLEFVFLLYQTYIRL